LSIGFRVYGLESRGLKRFNVKGSGFEVESF